MLWFFLMVDVFCFIVALLVLVLELVESLVVVLVGLVQQAVLVVLELVLGLLFFALLSHRLLLACR